MEFALSLIWVYLFYQVSKKYSVVAKGMGSRARMSRTKSCLHHLLVVCKQVQFLRDSICLPIEWGFNNTYINRVVQRNKIVNICNI